MNRLSRLCGSALIGLVGIAASAAADGPDATARGARAHRFRPMEKCLSTVGLSSEQQSGIQAIQSESRPTMQADFAALKQAREKLDADLASGADKSVLGQDVLDKEAAEAKLRDDRKATHDRIVATLRSDQKLALETCLSQRHRKGEGAPDTLEP